MPFIANDAIQAILGREIGRLITQLKAMDGFENTVSSYASDNGASA